MTKILIIDDEVVFTDLMRMNLEKTGEFKVKVENESTLALRAAREFEPDVILLDIVMPGMDGGDLSARFRCCRRQSHGAIGPGSCHKPTRLALASTSAPSSPTTRPPTTPSP